MRNGGYSDGVTKGRPSVKAPLPAPLHRAMVSTHHYTNFGDIAGPQSGPLYTEGSGKDYGMADDPQGARLRS